MSERPFMQLYVSDFIGDTLQLSTEQIGAYMLLLMAMWNAGGRLPDDDARLARVARLSLKKWRAISDDLMPFFEREEGEIGHKRLTRELRKASGKSEARAAAGARGGAATALKTKARAAANAGVLPRHFPDSRNQNEKASALSREKPDGLSGENVRGSSQRGPKRPSGWHRPKTHTDAANTIIEEIANHDRSRIAAGDEGAGGDVLMLPAIGAD
ncbi:YdaU family protein [Mesorhizobium sp.]|uniref:YdaU family protein n=1 Tax=Mesorhizobium sp. TaxID=1871066 RepID=UPI003569B627